MKTLGEKILAVALTLTACSGAAPAGESEKGLSLVENGKPLARIVIATNATRAAQFAAFELQYHIRKITDASLPIVTDESEVKGPRLLVGPSRATEALGLRAGDFKQPQEYLIKFAPDAIVLMGKDAPDTGKVKYDENDFICYKTWPDFLEDQATCYAVYDFLERCCDVRWYQCNELGMVFPRKTTLAVSGADIRRAPAFLHRRPSYLSMVETEVYDHNTSLWDSYRVRGKPGPEDKYAELDAAGWPELMKKYPDRNKFLAAKRGQVQLWFHRTRQGGEKYACNHSFYGYYERFLKTNPEYFAKGYDAKKEPPQPCYNNPGFIQQVVQDACDFFDGKGKKPGAEAAGDYFGLVPMDNGSWCKCPACQAQLNNEMRNKFFSNGYASDYIFGFANKVAAEVRKKHPDKIIATVGYADYAYPPVKVKVEPNISVGLCLHVRMHYSKLIQANDEKLLNDWVTQYPGKRFFLFLYYCFPVLNARYEAGSKATAWHCFPGFFAHQIDHAFKLYQKSGVRGVFFDSFGQEVDAYVTLKMLDDPSISMDALLDEYFARLFGAAAEPIKQMYLKIEEIYCDPANYPADFIGHQTKAIAWEKLGTPERMAELGKLMDAARQAARTENEKKQVALWDKQVWEYLVTGRKLYDTQKNTPIQRIQVPKAQNSDANGEPAKADWSKALVLNQWSAGTDVPSAVSGRIIHDGRFLYIQLEDPTDTSKLVRGTAIYDGDDWEIIYAAQRSAPYRQIAVGPDGKHLDLDYAQARALGGRGSPCESGIRIISNATAPNRWTVQLSLPLENLVPGGAKPGQKFYMNFFRIGWKDTLAQVSAWSPTFSGPHEVERLGTLTLE